MIDLLKRHRVLICAGTGGVGKTSLSASLGVLAAQAGVRTLVLTIDPAHRLAQALGIEAHPGEDVPVTAVSGLSACMIDPRREFDQFVLGSVDNVVAKSLFENRLYQQLVSNLNGSQEFTSLVRLLTAARDERYDLIILDTPPTQNAVDFLRAPERLNALFQDSVIGWFANTHERDGFLKRTLSRGTRLVTSALEAVTGGTFIAELKDFFTHIAHLRGRIGQVSRDVHTLLHADTTGFFLITGFDETKLKEALEFQADLKQERLKLRGVIVNRWFPEWADGRDDEASFAAEPGYETLKKFYERFKEYFQARAQAFDRFNAQLNAQGEADTPVLKLPDFKNTVQGLEDLKQVAESLRAKWSLSNEQN